jgi:hypothetical protein
MDVIILRTSPPNRRFQNKYNANQCPERVRELETGDGRQVNTTMFAMLGSIPETVEWVNIDLSIV